MSWNPANRQRDMANEAIYARFLKLQEAEKKRIEEEEKKKAILAQFPKPPLDSKDAPSGKISEGIAAAPGATRRNVGPLKGYGRKRKLAKTRRNRRLKKK